MTWTSDHSESRPMGGKTSLHFYRVTLTTVPYQGVFDPIETTAVTLRCVVVVGPGAEGLWFVLSL